MNGDGDKRWFVCHADLIYKLVLVALVGMWVVFPPHASQPAAAHEQLALLNLQLR